MLDELERGKDVCPDIGAWDASTAGPTQLVMAIHDEAARRRVAVIMTSAGERALRLEIET